MTKQKIRQSGVTYAVLTFCLFAAAIGAWSLSRAGTKREAETEPFTYTQPSAQDVEAAVPLADIPYTEPETVTEYVTEQTTEAESPFVLPMGNYIAKDYSAGAVVYSNTMRDWRVHNGVDFGDSRGQSVLAIADGTVADLQTDVLWGTVLTIEHPDGLTAKYCGLEKDSTPQIGETVEKGVVIGRLGEIPIESKDGPHLHLEITVNGALTDPLRFLKP